MSEIIPFGKMRLRSTETPPEKKQKYYFYCCVECGKGFSNTVAMESHERRVHKLCEICKVDFESINELKRHIEELHNINYCQKCKKQHRNRREYNECVRDAMYGTSPKKNKEFKEPKKYVRRTSYIKEEPNSDEEVENKEDDKDLIAKVETAPVDVPVEDEPETAEPTVDEPAANEPVTAEPVVNERKLHETLIIKKTTNGGWNCDLQAPKSKLPSFSSQSEGKVESVHAKDQAKKQIERQPIENRAEEPSEDLAEKMAMDEAPVVAESSSPSNAEQQKDVEMNSSSEGVTPNQRGIFYKPCEVCGITLTNRAGYVNHMKQHQEANELSADFTFSPNISKSESTSDKENCNLGTNQAQEAHNVATTAKLPDAAIDSADTHASKSGSKRRTSRRGRACATTTSLEANKELTPPPTSLDDSKSKHSDGDSKGFASEAAPQSGDSLPTIAASDWVCSKCQSAFPTVVELMDHLVVHMPKCELSDCKGCAKCASDGKTASVLEVKTQFSTDTTTCLEASTAGVSEEAALETTSKTDDENTSSNVGQLDNSTAAASTDLSAVIPETAQIDESPEQSTLTDDPGLAVLNATLPTDESPLPAAVLSDRQPSSSTLPSPEEQPIPDTRSTPKAAASPLQKDNASFVESRNCSKSSGGSSAHNGSSTSESVNDLLGFPKDKDDEEGVCLLTLTKEEEAIAASSRVYYCTATKECTFSSQCNRKFTHHCREAHTIDSPDDGLPAEELPNGKPRKRAFIRSYKYMFRCENCGEAYPEFESLLFHRELRKCFTFHCFFCNEPFYDDFELMAHHSMHVKLKMDEEDRQRAEAEGAQASDDDGQATTTAMDVDSMPPPVAATPPRSDSRQSTQPVATPERTSAHTTSPSSVQVHQKQQQQQQQPCQTQSTSTTTTISQTGSSPAGVNLPAQLCRKTLQSYSGSSDPPAKRAKTTSSTSGQVNSGAPQQSPSAAAPMAPPTPQQTRQLQTTTSPVSAITVPQSVGQSAGGSSGPLLFGSSAHQQLPICGPWVARPQVKLSDGTYAPIVYLPREIDAARIAAKQLSSVIGNNYRVHIPSSTTTTASSVAPTSGSGSIPLTTLSAQSRRKRTLILSEVARQSPQQMSTPVQPSSLSNATLGSSSIQQRLQQQQIVQQQLRRQQCSSAASAVFIGGSNVQQQQQPLQRQLTNTHTFYQAVSVKKSVMQISQGTPRQQHQQQSQSGVLVNGPGVVRTVAPMTTIQQQRPHQFQQPLPVQQQQSQYIVLAKGSRVMPTAAPLMTIQQHRPAPMVPMVLTQQQQTRVQQQHQQSHSGVPAYGSRVVQTPAPLTPTQQQRPIQTRQQHPQVQQQQNSHSGVLANGSRVVQTATTPLTATHHQRPTPTRQQQAQQLHQQQNSQSGVLAHGNGPRVAQTAAAPVTPNHQQRPTPLAPIPTPQSQVQQQHQQKSQSGALAHGNGPRVVQTQRTAPVHQQRQSAAPMAAQQAQQKQSVSQQQVGGQQNLSNNNPYTYSKLVGLPENPSEELLEAQRQHLRQIQDAHRKLNEAAHPHPVLQKYILPLTIYPHLPRNESGDVADPQRPT